MRPSEKEHVHRRSLLGGTYQRTSQTMTVRPTWPRHRSIAVSARWHDSTRLTMIAVALAAILSYILTHRGLAWALLALVVPCVALWVTRYRGNGFLFAVAILFVVPNWYPHVWLIAPIVGTVGLAAGIAKTRLRAVDVAFCVMALVLGLSWELHPELGVSLRLFVEGIMPLCYYILSRLTLTKVLLYRLLWAILLCAGLAACSVLYEAARGRGVFVEPQLYQWEGTASAVFRPGGIFGGSPTAAIVLAVMLLSTVSLYHARPRLVMGVGVLVVAAIMATLDRAGVIGLIGGALLMAILWPYRSWGRVAVAAFALSIAVYAVTSSPETLARLQSSKIVNAGLVRTNTLDARASLLSESLPLLADSSTHLFWGRGFDVLEAPGTHDAGLAATPDLWITHHGPNDDYVRAWLEQGLIGVIALVAWLLGSLVLGVRTCLRLPAQSQERLIVAGLTAGTFAYIVGSSGHDLTHNLASLSAGALVTGVLVSACTLLGGRHVGAATSSWKTGACQVG